MEYPTIINGVSDGEYAIAKLVTGEVLIGVLNLKDNTLDDIAHLIPTSSKEEDDEKAEPKLKFFTVPYCMPVTMNIKGESISLQFVMKCFPVTEYFAKIAEQYEKVRDGKANEQHT